LVLILVLEIFFCQFWFWSKNRFCGSTTFFFKNAHLPIYPRKMSVFYLFSSKTDILQFLCQKILISHFFLTKQQIPHFHFYSKMHICYFYIKNALLPHVCLQNLKFSHLPSNFLHKSAFFTNTSKKQSALIAIDQLLPTNRIKTKVRRAHFIHSNMLFPHCLRSLVRVLFAVYNRQFLRSIFV
jgi:hypothetical protein